MCCPPHSRELQIIFACFLPLEFIKPYRECVWSEDLCCLPLWYAGVCLDLPNPVDFLLSFPRSTLSPLHVWVCLFFWPRTNVNSVCLRQVWECRFAAFVEFKRNRVYKPNAVTTCGRVCACVELSQINHSDEGPTFTTAIHSVQLNCKKKEESICSLLYILSSVVDLFVTLYRFRQSNSFNIRQK